jgi:hypothetical protein
MEFGLMASCIIRRGGETFTSETKGSHQGFDVGFPRDFSPLLSSDELQGSYEVEWRLNFDGLAARDAFTFDDKGRLT